MAFFFVAELLEFPPQVPAATWTMATQANPHHIACGPGW